MYKKITKKITKKKKKKQKKNSKNQLQKTQKLSKIVKKSENLKKKLEKLLFFPKNMKFLKIFFVVPPKCYPISFPILGVRDSTRALQSSSFQIPGGEGSPEPDGQTEEFLVSNIGYTRYCKGVYIMIIVIVSS